MSKITLEPNSSGAGTFSIVSPSSNTNRTLNLPDDSGEIALAGAAGLKSIQVFTSNGTWTKPQGINYVKVYVTAGGGSGGTGDNSNNAGGGGGAGGTTIGIIDVTSVSSVSVTVGQGGAAQTGTGNRGNDGQSSSFGSFLTATSGEGGAYWASSSIGGRGGGVAGGDIKIGGGDGEQSTPHDDADEGPGGHGGASFWGGGGQGAQSYNSSLAKPAREGQAYGSGGGGGQDGDSGVTNSGAGREGIIVVEEYT